MFVPGEARRYLTPARVRDPLAPNDTLAPIRREALDVLGRAYGSGGRLLAGALVLVLGVGAVAGGVAAAGAAGAPARWLTGVAVVAGVLALTLGAAVVHAGGILSRGVAAWLAVPTRRARTLDRAASQRAVVVRAGLGAGLSVVALVLFLALALAAGAAPAVIGTAVGTGVGPGASPSTAVVVLGAGGLLAALTAAALLAGANRIHAAAWAPPAGPAVPAPARDRHTGRMLFVPRAAQAFLEPAEYRRDWATFGSMGIRRQSAVRTLLPAYTDLGRLAVGTLVWLAGLAGASLLRAGVGGESSFGLGGAAAVAAGAVLLLATAGAGTAVVLAGSRLARGTVLWASLPHLLRADGTRLPPTAPWTPAAPRQDDAVEGVSLLPRLLAGVVAVAVGGVWVFRLVSDAVRALSALAATADRLAVLGSVAGVAVSAVAAVTVLHGWAQVRAALNSRTGAAVRGRLLAQVNGPAGQPPVHHGDRHAGPAPTPAVATPAQYAAPAVPPVPAVTAAPAVPPVPAVPAAPVPPVYVGDRSVAAGRTLIGRGPAPRDGEELDRTLAVTDRTMSKTHLLLRVAPDGVWVTDRASTNGTVLVTADGERRLRPWEETPVPLGSSVRAGATRIAVGEENVERTVLR